jgi:prephenate dehydratase
MKKFVVAFQGEPGAYSEAAAYEHFGPDISSLPCDTFEKVFVSVSNENCTYGLIPIENSLAGSIHRNYDLMLRNDLKIISEYYLRVNHCLLALPDVKLEDIRRAHSHPQALAQCEANITQLGFEPVAERDTAGSARLIREKNDTQAAALASQYAAKVYDLEILKENMEDNPANFTRFLALSKQTRSQDEGKGSEFKTSVAFTLENKPGALFKALGVFALRDIDLTKIESRPLVGRPWEYMFYIDFIGNSKSKSCSRALDHLEVIAPYLRVLGSYPRHKFEH